MNTVQVAASVARLELTAFHHVALTVRDLDASAAWYTDVLGLSEVFREQRDGRKAAIMRFPAGGYCVALVEHTGTGADRFDPTRPGLDHLAFTVGSRNDLVHWAARLAEAAVTHTGPTDIATGAIVNLKDPDGTALAFFWDRPDHHPQDHHPSSAHTSRPRRQRLQEMVELPEKRVALLHVVDEPGLVGSVG